MDSGPAEGELRILARRYAALTRGIVATGCLVLGLIVVPGAYLWLAVPGTLALLAWIGWYTSRLMRSSCAWLVVCDVALVCLAALGQQWTVPPAAVADGTGWVLALVTVTVTALQWHTGVWAGAAALVLLVAAYVAGAWTAVGTAETHQPTLVLWAVWAGFLSRGCYRLLLSAGRRADALLAERERHRSALAVSAARRADEREQQALLHDTVAATLLMVGLGAVPGPRSWLADQASRDLLVLHRRAGPAVPTDLADLLSAEMTGSPVPVRHSALPRVVLPTPVAEAIAGGVREALQNVARHAGVEHATLSVATDPLRVGIHDAGRGFDPDRVPPHRRGVAESIVARMAAVGGRATVRSAPGEGTQVYLEWAGV
jgi:signal transduction histidine kinase